MDLNFGTFLLVLIVAVVALSFYEQIKKKNQVYCCFRRVDGTRVEKWVPRKSKFVIFEGGKYRINPAKRQLLWWNRGWLGLLRLGFYVTCYDYTWYNDQPLDPRDFSVTWDSPETRNMLSSEEDYKDFAKGAPPVGGKKESTFQRLVPWIALGVAVIAAFLVWQLRGDVAALFQLMQVK